MRVTTPHIQMTPAVSRQTAPGNDQRFHAALSGATAAMMGGVETVAAAVPGGPVMSAVLSSRVQAAGTDGAANASLSGESLALIELQRRVSAESRHFSMISNVMKARHETAKASINNIR